MKKSLSSILYFLGLFLLSILFFFPFWITWHYGQVSLDQILFHLNTPWSGINPKVFSLLLKELGFLSLTLTLLWLILPVLGPASFKAWTDRHKKALLFSFFIFVIASFHFHFNLVDWYHQIFGKPTLFYEENYVRPDPSNIRFPTQKRNVIYVMMESMENTFAFTGTNGQNLIPDLQKLADENYSFRGYYPSVGTQWTSASMVAGLCGLPLKSLSTKTVQFATFLPNVTAVTEIFKQNGYSLTFLMGSDASYANKEVFLKDHGFDAVLDFPIEARETVDPSDMGSEWGLKDRVLFERARQELTRLSSSGQPFFMGILTLDMHPPEGYLDPACPIVDEDMFNNVVHCTNLIVTDFVKWVQKQPFAANTTLILTGDHLAWGADKYADKRAALEKNRREALFILINPVTAPEQTQRRWAMYDMAPTILESVGAFVPHHRFGLGTSLLSDEKTLLEKQPPEQIDRLIESKSILYRSLCGIQE